MPFRIDVTPAEIDRLKELQEVSTLAEKAQPGIRQRMLWGLSAQSVAIALRVVQQLLLVPVLIWGWGADLYQDWIILFSASGFLSMLDFGMQIYFGNALLIAWSRQDFAAYRRFLATAFAMYSVILLGALVLLIAVSRVVSWPSLLGIRAMSGPAALTTLSLLVLTTLSLIPLGIVTAIYRARGDYGVGTVVMVIVEASRGFGVCLVAALGGTPIAAAIVHLLIAGVFWFAVSVHQRRRYGELPLAFAVPTKLELKEGLSQSALYMAPTIVTPVVLNCPVVLLGLLGSPPGTVVAFTVSRTLTGLLRQIVLQFCHPVGAEMSRQLATHDLGKVKLLFNGAGRLAAGIAGLLGGFTMIVAEPFIHLWTHGAVAYDPWLIGMFIATILLTAPAQVPLMLFHYANRPLVLVIAQGAYAISAIAFCFLFIPGFIDVGAAAGIGLAELLTIGLIIPFAAAKMISADFFGYAWRGYVLAGMTFVASYAAAWCLQQIMGPQSLFGIIEFAMTWVAVITLPSLFLLLARTERDWFINIVRHRLTRIVS